MCKLILLTCALLAAATVWGGEQPASPSALRLVVDLVDGSRVIGESSLKTVPLKTSYARLDVPVDQVLSVAVGDDRETLTLWMRNGDVVTGHSDLAAFELATIFGGASIALHHVRRVELNRVRTDGLVLHYTFDHDADGRVVDSSGNGNHGRLVGKIAYVDSIRGTAPRLTSHRTYIVSDAERLNTKGWEGLTVSTWVKMKQTATRGRIINRGMLRGERGGGFHLCIGGSLFGSGNWKPGGTFGVMTSATNREMVTASSLRPGVKPHPATERWYHLVGTYDGRTVKYYVDGVLDGTLETAEPGALLWDAPGTSLVIGNAASASRVNWTDYYFDGLIDEVQLWRRCLSAEEVGVLYRTLARPPAVEDARR